MTAKFARFANDCYHLWRAPAGSKAAILKDFVLPNHTKMGFCVSCFDRQTLKFLFRESSCVSIITFVRKMSLRSFWTAAQTWAWPLSISNGLILKRAFKRLNPTQTTFQLLKKNVVQNHFRTHSGSLRMSAEDFGIDGRTVQVPARRLSDFVAEDVDFLKFDVEGAEHRVLRDLARTGKIRAIRQMVIEYHHRISHQKSHLAGLLGMLEEAGFEHQVHGAPYPLTANDSYQTILIGGYQ